MSALHQLALRSAGFAALAGGACGDEPPLDPLDPQTLVDIARAGGDGEGEALSGRYAVVSVSTACDCPARAGLDLCAPEFAVFAGLSGPILVTQTGGYLTWVPEGGGALGMSGAVERDASFELAALYDIGTLLGEGGVYARFAGEFDGARRVRGDLDLRVVGTFEDAPLDCRLRYEVSGAPAPGP